MIAIVEDDLSGGQTRALLAFHLEGMHAASPPGSVFALDLVALRGPDITVWSAWDGDRIAGIGALKRLAGGGGELKSMRTHPDYVRQGIARLLLCHIIAQARAEGIVRLSLETGSGTAFAPAIALYRAHGFTTGAAFGGYEATAFNQFLHRAL